MLNDSAVSSTSTKQKRPTKQLLCCLVAVLAGGRAGEGDIKSAPAQPAGGVAAGKISFCLTSNLSYSRSFTQSNYKYNTYAYVKY